MFDDSVADFWKDKLVHLMHRNMMRADAQGLSLKDAELAFKTFENSHPEIKAVSNISSYATFEFNFTSDLKFRVYIQSQIKVTIMQLQNGEYIKLCDARFPNNPFPEIDMFLSMLPDYLNLLKSQKLVQAENSRKSKVLKHFITALLEEKFENQKELLWNLEEENQDFVLKISENGKEKQILLNQSDFVEKIEAL